MTAPQSNGMEACMEWGGTSADSLNTSFIGQTLSFDHSVTDNLMSPNYPYAYSNRMHCTWSFILAPDQTLALTFVDFSVESQ